MKTIENSFLRVSLCLARAEDKAMLCNWSGAIYIIKKLPALESGKTGNNIEENINTCARKTRERTYPRDGNLSIIYPTRALDVLSGYHGKMERKK